MLKELDKLTMKVWNDEKLTNKEKNEIVKKLQEIQMILQGEYLCDSHGNIHLWK